MNSSRLSPKSQSFFKEDTTLSETEQKYCRCIPKVAAKQDPECLGHGAPQGGGCYNPYAVCKHSTGQKANVSCGAHYDYNKMPDKYLIAYARMKSLTIPEPYDRAQVVQEIMAYKAGEK